MMHLFLIAQLLTIQPTHSPGATRQLSTRTVCLTKWADDDRHVTAEMKATVLRRYKMTAAQMKQCCVYDHVIPRSLAGKDSANNIVPQIKSESYRKDVLERKLHRDVCKGNITLKDAQSFIRVYGMPGVWIGDFGYQGKFRWLGDYGKSLGYFSFSEWHHELK